MKTLAAFYRLALRPDRVAIAIMQLFMATLWIGDGWADGLAPTPRTIVRLWRVTVSGSVIAGFMVGAMTAEVQANLFAWSLPSLRRRFVAGTMQVMALVLVGTMILHRALGGNPVAAIGIAALAYSVGVMLTSPAYPGRLRLAAALAVFAAVTPVGGQTVYAIASSSPRLIGVVTLAIGTWCIGRGLMPGGQRTLALLRLQPGVPSRDWWALVGWAHRPARGERIRQDATVDWLDAMAEQGRSGWLGAQLWFAAVAAVLGYTMNNATMLFMLMAVMGSSAGSFGVAGQFVYPLSRRRRAIFSYQANLASTATFTLLFGAISAVLFSLDPWPRFFGSTRTVEPVSMVVAWITSIVIWIPIAQWPSSRPPILDAMARKARASHRSMVMILLVVIMTMLAFISIKAYEAQVGHVPSVGLAAEAALAIAVTQSIFYSMLQRTYARNDLV